MTTCKILQLTDTHLFQSSGNKLFGVDTNKNFFQTIDFIQKNAIQFDYIFLTGDISQDETTASYEIISKELSECNKKIYWIAGNHDDFFKMQQVFSQYPLFEHVDNLFLDKINWRFIFVDSVLKGKDSGYLTQNNLKALSDNLFFSNNATTAIVMHHHPIHVGTPLIDQYILKNSDEFLKIIAESKSKVELVICGHVHGNYDIAAEGIRLISSPATCLQWKKGATEIMIDDVCGFTLWSFFENRKFTYETFLI